VSITLTTMTKGKFVEVVLKNRSVDAKDEKQERDALGDGYTEESWAEMMGVLRNTKKPLSAAQREADPNGSPDGITREEFLIIELIRAGVVDR
jgi:hypothetical protein